MTTDPEPPTSDQPSSLPPLRREQSVPYALAFEGSLIGLALLLGYLLDWPPLEFCDLTLSGALTGLAATVPMLIVLAALLGLPWPPFRRLRAAWEESIAPVFHDWSPWEVASLALVAGVGEEMLFRGVIQAATAGWLGSLAGLAVASVLFGLPHAITFTYAVAATLLGAYLGWLFLSTGNLLAPIVAHAVYDFVALEYLIHASRRAGNQQKTAA
ncbi:MAG: CPBP family intramembrane metalloprotease [Pirellulales bacterium]|nr:CPBP family intramembrane metalloprotease [Pirellulales bacterium]